MYLQRHHIKVITKQSLHVTPEWGSRYSQNPGLLQDMIPIEYDQSIDGEDGVHMSDLGSMKGRCGNHIRNHTILREFCLHRSFSGQLPVAMLPEGQRMETRGGSRGKFEGQGERRVATASQ